MPAELREIVKEACVYGFPMVDSYRIQHSYFVDETNSEFKGAWNQPHSVARVYTPQDTAIQTPNSDTPYTFLGADLRAEPLLAEARGAGRVMEDAAGRARQPMTPHASRMNATGVDFT